jgi:hypothetical protein
LLRTQGVISQTLLSVGRKDPRVFLCVCVQGRDARNSYGISFHSHGKVAPQLLCFLSARGEDELILSDIN